MRFFFDYTTEGQSIYDHHGEEFVNLCDAGSFAEATVQVLRNSLDGLWKGWKIEVRSAEGQKYFSFSVDNEVGLDSAAPEAT